MSPGADLGAGGGRAPTCSVSGTLYEVAAAPAPLQADDITAVMRRIVSVMLPPPRAFDPDCPRLISTSPSFQRKRWRLDRRRSAFASAARASPSTLRSVQTQALRDECGSASSAGPFLRSHVCWRKTQPTLPSSAVCCKTCRAVAFRAACRLVRRVVTGATR